MPGNESQTVVLNPKEGTPAAKGAIRIFLESGKVSPPTDLAVSSDGKGLRWSAPPNADDQSSYSLTFIDATLYPDVHSQVKDTSFPIPAGIKQACLISVCANRDENSSAPAYIKLKEGLTQGTNYKNLSLVGPWGVAADENQIYVASSSAASFGGSTITVVDRNTGSKVGVYADGLGLENPYGVAVDGSRLYITQSKGGIVVADKDTGARVNVNFDSALGLSSPRGVAVDGDRLYVANSGGKSIAVADKNTGSKVAVFSGTELGLERPVGIITDGGRLYIADESRKSITIMDKNSGNVLGIFAGSELGLARPLGVAVDGDWLLIADAAENSIVVADKLTGRKISSFVGSELGFGSSYAISAYRGFFYITDYTGSGLFVTGRGGWMLDAN
ncbi:outer membrane protein assembly factor BamB family protein [Streptomyces sp. CAS3]